MPKKITLVGLGQIGASIGLALEQYKSSIKRVGHDKKPETAKAAQEKGAVDEINFNLPASVRNSDLVILALPLHEIEAALKSIGTDLKEGAVVADTAPVKAKVAEWAARFVPAGRSYVGLVPSIGPDHLLDVGAGPASAKADLFKEGIFMVCPAPSASEAAVKLAADLLELLGAKPMFTEPLEADGLMAALHTLPELMGIALLNATVKQPGWKEARMMAGRPYALVSAAALYHDEVGALAQATEANRENVTRVLDNAVRSLIVLREAIKNGEWEQVEEAIEDANFGGMQWLRERLGAEWDAEDRPNLDIPSFSERLFGAWVNPDRMRPGKKK